MSERLVHVGWYCWRCQALCPNACRSDSVPVYVPEDWAEEMETEIEDLRGDA
jgi:hypothetical protein